MKDRVHFLDQIRWLNTFLLVAIHCLLVYGSYDIGFYIRGKALPAADFIVESVEPWFMQLMFAVAGAVSIYSLRRRGALAYIGERAKRLLLPAATGVLVICPALTYFAERFHNGYAGGYLAQYSLFFSKFIWYDPRGYSGGFSVGHYWFLLMLITVSVAAIPAMLLHLRRNPKDERAYPRGILFLTLGVVPYWFSAFFIALAGRPVPQYLLAFLAGALLLSNADMQDKAVKYRYVFLALSAAAFLLRWRDAADLRCCISYYLRLPKTAPELLYSVEHAVQGWFGLLAIFGFAKKYLNFRTSFTDRMSRFSFPLYYFNLVWVVAASYWLYYLALPVALKVSGAVVFTVVMSALCYALVRRTPVLRFLMGIPAYTGNITVAGRDIDEAAKQ